MSKHCLSGLPGQTSHVQWVITVLLMLWPTLINAQGDKPNVAILVYDGVQIIDHAVPFEVLGQYSLNNVYTVSADGGPITTYMGMRVLPNYSFADAPNPDVLVLPGGDAGEAQRNQGIVSWVKRTVSEVDHILTVCTGIFFLAGNEVLDGKQITTWYDRQAELQRISPRAEVVSDRTVVESGRLVSSAGLGVDGALRIVARLHGEAWAEVVRLNMEHQPIPLELHVPRAELADVMLPGGVYAVFPWREAELLRYEGNRDKWSMDWRFDSQEPMGSLSARFREALNLEEGWDLVSTESERSAWNSEWTIGGSGESVWQAVIRLRDLGNRFDLEMNVKRQIITKVKSERSY
jgi:putative intracellular protease/amidase